MVTAMVAATMVTMVAAAAAKTMVATIIAGGKNNNQLKAAAEETLAVQRWRQRKQQRQQKWRLWRDKNSADANNGTSTTAIMMTHPGSALRQKTTLLPWPSHPCRHHRRRRAEMLAAMGMTTTATVAAVTSMTRTTAGEMKGVIVAGVECKPEQWGIWEKQ
jgi:hypothetical protein